MQLDRQFLDVDDGAVPAVVLTPRAPCGAAVVIHGYGGSKEEILGLAWRIASVGLVTCAIDLRGHGQSLLSFDVDVLRDVGLAVDGLRRWGKVVAVGHSLGGRLALLSAADFAIGISPALDREYAPTTQRSIDDRRSYRVREELSGFGVLRALPEWQPGPRPTAVVFGSRDVPEIAEACRRVAHTDAAVTEIDSALHGDIFLVERTFEVVERQLVSWFASSVGRSKDDALRPTLS